MRASGMVLAVLFATVLAAGTAVGQGPPLDPEHPSLEFVMNIEEEPTILGSQNLYNYELHPHGQHGAVNGKYYGSSEVELDGHKVFEFTMPYENPTQVFLDSNGTVDASFVFGVTNRGQGTYQVSWNLFADEAIITEGPVREFSLQGAGTDVGARLEVWETAVEQATIPAGAILSLHLEVSYSGNAPFVKDRGIRIDLPGLPTQDDKVDAEDQAANDADDPSTESALDPQPEATSDTSMDPTTKATGIPAGGPGMVVLGCLIAFAALRVRRA